VDTDRSGLLREAVKLAPALKYAGPGLLAALVAKFDTPGKAGLLVVVYLCLNVLQRVVNPALDALGQRLKQAIERSKDRGNPGRSPPRRKPRPAA